MNQQALGYDWSVNIQFSYFWRIQWVIGELRFTSCVLNVGSKTEFANNSLHSSKIGELNIDTSIIPQGLLTPEKKQSSKISLYCPFKVEAVGICAGDAKTYAGAIRFWGETFHW